MEKLLVSDNGHNHSGWGSDEMTLLVLSQVTLLVLLTYLKELA